MPSERSQTETENNYMISLICGTKKRKTKNFMDTENGFVVARGRGYQEGEWVER